MLSVSKTNLVSFRGQGGPSSGGWGGSGSGRGGGNYSYSSNFYIGCSENPNFKYERGLTQESMARILKEYGEKALSAAKEAVANGKDASEVLKNFTKL